MSNFFQSEMVRGDLQEMAQLQEFCMRSMMTFPVLSTQKQLDYFNEEFGFVKKDEFVDSFNGRTLPQGVVLTFDDGFSCHYDFVFKELKKRDLWGIFYIPTQPYTQGQLIDVHRIHVLLSKHNPKKLYDFLIDTIEDSFIEKDKINEFRNKTYTRQKNDYYTNFIKKTLNYYKRRERCTFD